MFGLRLYVVSDVDNILSCVWGTLNIKRCSLRSLVSAIGLCHGPLAVQFIHYGLLQD